MTSLIAQRSIDRVIAKTFVGPNAQVDDRAVIIAPVDPSLTDPFLLLAEDWFSSPGFDWHPHRGFEAITTVLDGVFEHGDNLGNTGTLQPGDVQWMTAGRAILHRELAYRDEPVHGLQLWLNLPAKQKMAATRYQDLRAAARPRILLPGVTVDVISGTIAGVTGPALNHHPVQAFIVTLEPQASYDLSVPASHRAFAYVHEGELTISAEGCGPVRSLGPTQPQTPHTVCSRWLLRTGRPGR